MAWNIACIRLCAVRPLFSRVWPNVLNESAVPGMPTCDHRLVRGSVTSCAESMATRPLGHSLVK
eukprot:10805677-Alexandrium_andersonii.AAC.1